MKKPVQEIERMRNWLNGNYWSRNGQDAKTDVRAILAYLDSLPEWPADLTREALEELAENLHGYAITHANDCAAVVDALRRLAAIAPTREKRKVALWEQRDVNNDLLWKRDMGWAPRADVASFWRKVGECEVDA